MHACSDNMFRHLTCIAPPKSAESGKRNCLNGNGESNTLFLGSLGLPIVKNIIDLMTTLLLSLRFLFGQNFYQY